jgi:hypothetical protein
MVVTLGDEERAALLDSVVTHFARRGAGPAHIAGPGAAVVVWRGREQRIEVRQDGAVLITLAGSTRAARRLRLARLPLRRGLDAGLHSAEVVAAGHRLRAGA